jgi:hypothetical protein
MTHTDYHLLVQLLQKQEKEIQHLHSFVDSLMSNNHDRCTDTDYFTEVETTIEDITCFSEGNLWGFDVVSNCKQSYDDNTEMAGSEDCLVCEVQSPIDAGAPSPTSNFNNQWAINAV